MGIDPVGMELLEVAYYQIVGELLGACCLWVLVEGFANGGVVGHSFIICSRKKSPRCSKLRKAS